MFWAMLMAGAQDYQPAFEPSRLKTPDAAPVLVLGTAGTAGMIRRLRGPRMSSRTSRR